MLEITDNSKKKRIAFSSTCSQLCSTKINSTCVSSLTSLPFGGGVGYDLVVLCHVITLECIDLKSQGVSILALSAYMIGGKNIN
jgi:hypothetical protein